MANTSFGGPWTQQKLNILRGYLEAYTTLMKEKPSKERPFRLIYVDAFAGGGLWSPKSGYTEDVYGEARELHKGSPLIALDVKDKPFDKLVFVEKDPLRSESLKRIQKDQASRDIEIINADANRRFLRSAMAYATLIGPSYFSIHTLPKLLGKRLKRLRERGRSIAGYSFPLWESSG